MNKAVLGVMMLVLSLLLAGIGAVVFESNTESGSSYVATSVKALRTQSNTGTGEFLDLGQVLAQSTRVTVADQATSSAQTAEDTEESAVKPITRDVARATVNIRCTQQMQGFKRIITGTGFLINETGVILTNAHVAQFLLLKNASGNGKAECSASIGGDESASYEVNLLYISPSWLLDHADLIGSLAPKGTGESDFALVYITPETGTTFADFLPPATTPLSKSFKDKEVTIIGYPRQEDKTTPQMIATSTITALYTFGSGYADIFSLASSTLGHQGSSGGPVIDEYGRSIGILTTKDAGTTILNAITTAHIDRSIKEETGFDLTSYLTGNLTYKAELFNQTVAPILQQLLSANLAE